MASDECASCGGRFYESDLRRCPHCHAQFCDKCYSGSCENAKHFVFSADKRLQNLPPGEYNVVIESEDLIMKPACTCRTNALGCPVHPGGLERETLKGIIENAAKCEPNPEVVKRIMDEATKEPSEGDKLKEHLLRNQKPNLGTEW